MTEEIRCTYRFSDIEKILMECSKCGEESPFPWEYNPYLDVGGGLTRAYSCPHCKDTKLDDVVRTLYRIVNHLREMPNVKVEVKEDSASR